MTQDKASKKAARKRMAETGEPYTVARRATKAQHEIHDAGAQERAAELARQADALRDQSMQIYRAAQQYVRSARTAKADIQSVARQLSEALDQNTAEVVAAVQSLAPQLTAASLSGEGTLIAGGHVRAYAGLAEARGTAPNPTVITVSDGDTITIVDTDRVQPENLNRLFAQVARDGIAGLSAIQVLALVLVCLLSIGLPFAQLTLPPEAQMLLTDEYSTVGLGLAIALVIIQNRRR